MVIKHIWSIQQYPTSSLSGDVATESFYDFAVIKEFPLLCIYKLG